MKALALALSLALAGTGLAKQPAPPDSQASAAAQNVKVHDDASVVLIGKSGWLFYKPELHYSDYTPNIRDIAFVSEQLKGKNVKLLVTLSPIKARLYEQYLPEPLPAEVKDRYRNVLDSLDKAGVATVDLNTPLAAQAKTSATPLYYLHDSHWNDTGAFLAAKVVAEATARLTDLTGLPNVSYTMSESVKPHPSDLVLKLSPAQQAHFPAEKTRTFSFEQRQPASALTSNAPLPGIVEVGASFSAVGNFVPAIAYDLHKDVLNMAVSAVGPWKALGDYLTSENFAKSPPKVIIWEITERDIGWLASDEWLDTTFRKNPAFKK